nr:hypothetical protein [Tanacetum cinerariifolium]
MALTFAHTHNMIAYLTKLDASEGYDQIIDFLNTSSIQYALTINPNIYVSCIKQFWSSVSIKKTNDVVRLQALIDKKKVIITEDTVRQALRLDDAESIDCLPNEEIFTELARMGYEKPSTKLTFYKAFFSAQWKFLIHTILQCISAKKTAWNKFSSSMALAVICLAIGMLVPQQAAIDVDDVVAASVPANDAANIVPDDVVDVVAHTDAEPTQPLPTPTTTPPPPQQEVTSTPPLSPHQSPQQQTSSPPQQPQPSQTITISLDLLNNLLETCTALTKRVEHLEQDKIAQALEITKLKQMVKILEKKNKLKVFGLKRLRKVWTTQRIESSADTVMDDQEDASKHRGIIELIDANKDVILEEVDAEKDAKVAKENADIQGRQKESQAQAYHIDLEHVGKVLSMHDDEPEPAELKEVIEVVTTAKLMTEVVTTATTTISAAPISVATITAAPTAARRRKWVVIRDPKEAKQAQIEQDEAYARELEAELNRNINWDDVIEQIKEKGKQENVVLRYQALKRKPQTKAQARKNMMVYLKNMAGFKMDYFKGMSYDDICLIFEKYFNSNVAFLEKSKEQLEEEESRALKREDLEMLWQIVQDRFASSKPKNFSDDFLLITLKPMFEKPDVEDQTYCYWYKLMLLENAADSRLRLLEQSAATGGQCWRAHWSRLSLASAESQPWPLCCIGMVRGHAPLSHVPKGVMLQGNHEIEHVEDKVPLTEHLTRKRNNKTDEAGESSSVTVGEELNPSPTLVVALNVIPLIIR